MLFSRRFIILAQWKKCLFVTKISRRGQWGGCVDSVRKSYYFAHKVLFPALKLVFFAGQKYFDRRRRLRQISSGRCTQGTSKRRYASIP